MNAKTLKATKTTIEFVRECKNNKDYPYYLNQVDLSTVIAFLEFKVKEQETKNENRKNGLKGIL